MPPKLAKRSVGAEARCVGRRSPREGETTWGLRAVKEELVRREAVYALICEEGDDRVGRES